MLLSLFHWLSGYVRAFAVFDYLSLRAVLAALTALVIGLAFGPFTIRELKKLHFGQAVRTDRLSEMQLGSAGRTITARS